MLQEGAHWNTLVEGVGVEDILLWNDLEGKAVSKWRKIHQRLETFRNKVLLISALHYIAEIEHGCPEIYELRQKLTPHLGKLSDREIVYLIVWLGIWVVSLPPWVSPLCAISYVMLRERILKLIPQKSIWE